MADVKTSTKPRMLKGHRYKVQGGFLDVSEFPFKIETMILVIVADDDIYELPDGMELISELT